MQAALQKRQLEETLAVLRLRIEADEGCGQSANLRACEGLLLKGDLGAVRERIDKIIRELADRATRLEGRANREAAVSVARGRNETVSETAGGVEVLSRDGLLWLVRRGRLNGSCKVAAERYRRDYGAAHMGGLGSALADPERGHTPFVGFTASEAKTTAIRDLDDARLIGLGGDGALVRLMDEVAGRGATLRDLAKGDRHGADRLETEFLVACRLLAAFYTRGARRRQA
jgi:hypothetical protein